MDFTRDQVPASGGAWGYEDSSMSVIWILSLRGGFLWVVKQNKTERTVDTKSCFGKPLTNCKVQGEGGIFPSVRTQMGLAPNIKVLNNGPRIKVQSNVLS